MTQRCRGGGSFQCSIFMVFRGTFEVSEKENMYFDIFFSQKISFSDHLLSLPCERHSRSQTYSVPNSCSKPGRYPLTCPAAEKQSSSTDVDGYMIPNDIFKYIHLYQKVRGLGPPDTTPLHSSQCENQKCFSYP